MPNKIPETVTSLYVGFCDAWALSEDVSGVGLWDPVRANLLLHSIRQLPDLKELTLVFDTIAATALTCPDQLSSLRSLTIKLELEDQSMDLSWVLKQACDSLTVRVRCQGSDPDRHHTVVQQLQEARLWAVQLCLELELQAPFTKQLQGVWSKLEVDTLTVSGWPCSGDPALFDNASNALEALPSCCDYIEVDCRMGSRAGPCYITWACADPAGSKH